MRLNIFFEEIHANICLVFFLIEIANKFYEGTFFLSLFYYSVTDREMNGYLRIISQTLSPLPELAPQTLNINK